ncbi:MAG: branched-chain amino acid ABC transporter permease [Ilumatobacteraceae bacterium]
MQIFANGVSIGAVLFLMAAGLSLLIGAMGVLNLAHGAVYMIGAYIGWMICVDHGLPFPVAVLGAGVGTALLGFVFERLFHLIQGQADQQILLSFGLIYVLVNLSQWIWGPVAKSPFQVSWLSGAVHIGGIVIPTARLAIAVVGFFVAGVLWFVQDKTRAGAIVRAGMDDPNMVRALGINLDVVVAGVFILGSAVAGVAGAMGGLVLGASSSQAIDVLLLALIVVVVGGVGSVVGTFASAMLIGVLDAYSRSWLPEMSSVVLYALMALVLVIRPTGLSGRVAR